MNFNLQEWIDTRKVEATELLEPLYTSDPKDTDTTKANQ